MPRLTIAKQNLLTICGSIAGSGLATRICEGLSALAIGDPTQLLTIGSASALLQAVGFGGLFLGSAISGQRQQRALSKDIAEILRIIREVGNDQQRLTERIERLPLSHELDQRLASYDPAQLAERCRQYSREGAALALSDVGITAETMELRDVTQDTILHIVRRIEGGLRQLGLGRPAVRTTLHMAPIAPEDMFVGRDPLLDELHARLARHGALAVTAVQGEGGVGKSALAYHYARQHGDGYDGVWWLNADAVSIENAVHDHAAIMVPELPDDAGPDVLRRILARHWQTGRHLVIYDNVPDKKALTGLPRPGAGGAMIVATRHRRLFDTDEQHLEVPVLPREAARELLTRHRHEFRAPEHAAAIDGICVFLGDHTLAVKLAGAALKPRLMTPARLLERLRAFEVGAEGSVLRSLPEGELGVYGLGVAASLALLFTELKQPLALPVLALCAVLGPAGIPVELLRSVVAGEPDEVDAAMEELDQLSILTIESAGLASPEVTVHRLTQSVVRGRTPPDLLAAAVRAAADGLLQSLDDMTDHTRWADHDRYAPHAVALLELPLPKAAAGEPDVFAALGVPAALAAENRLRHDEALGLYSASDARFLAVGQGEHPKRAVTLSNRGDLERLLGKHEPALANLGEAERIDRAAFGDDHPNVATRVNNIGMVLKDKDDLDGALARFEQAERIFRVAFGNDHPNVAVAVNNIGGVLQAKRDLYGALAKFEEAERIDRAAFGDDHPNVAIRLNNIGGVLAAKGDPDVALANYSRAFVITLRAFGPRGQNVATFGWNVLLAGGDVRALAAGHLDPAGLEALRSAMIERGRGHYGFDLPDDWDFTRP